MSFAHPALLVGLVAIPVLIALYVRSERRPQAFAPAALMPSVVRRRPGWRRHAGLVGYGAAVVALLVALAKPQATVAVPVQQARVMIVTDHSDSMRATDIKPNRLVASERAADRFLDTVPDSVRVGAVAFAARAEVLQSPTRDHDAVREALHTTVTSGGTAVGDGVHTALTALPGRAPAALLLLTDGESNRGSDAVAAAQEAARRHIRVYTVALGTPGGTVNGKPAVADTGALATIARLTGGQEFNAESAGELTQIYKRLGSEIATEKRKTEVSDLFAGGALALMAMGALSSIRLRGRLV